jgi:hypothetical protein
MYQKKRPPQRRSLLLFVWFVLVLAIDMRTKWSPKPNKGGQINNTPRYLAPRWRHSVCCRCPFAGSRDLLPDSIQSSELK